MKNKYVGEAGTALRSVSGKVDLDEQKRKIIVSYYCSNFKNVI
jgi:hypothetical protein